MQLEDKEKYSLRHLWGVGIFGEVAYQTARNKLLEDRATDNLLKPEIISREGLRRYFILGKNAKKYLKANK